MVKTTKQTPKKEEREIYPLGEHAIGLFCGCGWGGGWGGGGLGGVPRRGVAVDFMKVRRGHPRDQSANHTSKFEVGEEGESNWKKLTASSSSQKNSRGSSFIQIQHGV